MRDLDRTGGPFQDPSPETFETLASWCDDPNRSPGVHVWVQNTTTQEPERLYTPGYLLRRIAEAYRAAQGDKHANT